MAEPKFDPNRLTLANCIANAQNALTMARIDIKQKIITSRDEGVLELKERLKTTNVPNGFHKWQLPVYLQDPSVMFITVGEPGAKAEPHSHDEGAGIRFIAGGSIIYGDKELTAGDWMFIPAGVSYEFQVGPLGAVMCYCYCC